MMEMVDDDGDDDCVRAEMGIETKRKQRIFSNKKQLCQPNSIIASDRPSLEPSVDTNGKIHWSW